MKSHNTVSTTCHHSILCHEAHGSHQANKHGRKSRRILPLLHTCRHTTLVTGVAVMYCFPAPIACFCQPPPPMARLRNVNGFFELTQCTYHHDQRWFKKLSRCHQLQIFIQITCQSFFHMFNTNLLDGRDRLASPNINNGNASILEIRNTRWR